MAYKFEDFIQKKDCFAKYKHVESEPVFGHWEGDAPLITIFIPTYRRPDTLQRALQSALDQKTDEPYDILVVDNDPEKQTETECYMQQMCSKYTNICYFRNRENIGMFGNWNRGFELVRTKYISVLHDDDVLLTNYINEVLNVFQEKSCQIVSVFSKSQFLDEDTKLKTLNGFKNIISKITRGQPFLLDVSDNYRSISCSPAATAYECDAVIALGGFNDEFHPTGDGVLFSNSIYFYRAYILPRFLVVKYIGKNELFKPNMIQKESLINYQFLRLLGEKLYGNRKRWIAEYGGAVNFLIFPAQRYNPDLDIEAVLKENALPLKWKCIPDFILKLILAWFWIRAILRNPIKERTKRCDDKLRGSE